MRLRVVLASLAILALPALAKADTFQTFTLSGIDGVDILEGPLSGNLTVDTTSNLITSIDITFTVNIFGDPSLPFGGATYDLSTADSDFENAIAEYGPNE